MTPRPPISDHPMEASQRVKRTRLANRIESYARKLLASLEELEAHEEEYGKLYRKIEVPAELIDRLAELEGEEEIKSMTNNVESLKSKLLDLLSEIHSTGNLQINFHQQRVSKKNMGFTGGDGKVWVQPFQDRYDISLSGKSLTELMTPFMRSLCDKENDGYKQTKPEPHQPYWRIDDFELVIKAVKYYSKISS